MEAQSLHPGGPKVGDQLRHFARLAASSSKIVWRSVGAVVSESDFVA
jgi:hypothetical protein